MTRAQREPWYDELPVTEGVMNYDHLGYCPLDPNCGD